MSFSNSLPANPMPQHFERIAKSFLEKRRRGDTSSCDLKINLKNGTYDLVHSNVVCVNSMFLNTMLETQRPPYQPIDLSDFEPASVRRTIDWMYSGVFNFPESELAQDLAVASFLQVNLLQNRFEQKIRNIQGQPIKALNIATKCSFSPKKNESFRPWLTMMHVSAETMNALVIELSQMVDTMTLEQVGELEMNSIIACMSACLPLDTKIQLINLAIQWILDKQADRDVVLPIVQSIIISDITFSTTYWIRYYLNQYLENPKTAGKGLIRMHKDGTISIFVDPRDGKDRIKWNPPIHRNKEMNQKVAQWKSDYDKKAMDELRKGNVGGFGRSSTSSTSDPHVTKFRRETSDGVPKYFTRSEVANLNDMEDEFVTRPNEFVPNHPRPAHIPGFSTMPCTAGYAGFDPDRLAANKAKAAVGNAYRERFTESEREENRAMQDPFVAKKKKSNTDNRSSNSRSSNSHSSRSNKSLNSKSSNSGANQFKGQGHGQSRGQSHGKGQGFGGQGQGQGFGGQGFGQAGGQGFGGQGFGQGQGQGFGSQGFGKTGGQGQSFGGQSQGFGGQGFGGQGFGQTGGQGFGQGQGQGPVLLCPARNSGFGGSSRRGNHNSSFSGFPHRSNSSNNHLNQTIQPDFLVTDTSTRSSASTTSIRNPPMQGVRKTQSEIDEINRLPSLGGASSSTSSGNQGKKPFPKSDYLYPK